MNYQTHFRMLALMVGIGTLGCKSSGDSGNAGGGGGGGEAGSAGGDSGGAGKGGSTAKGGSGGGSAGTGGGAAGTGGGSAGAGGGAGAGGAAAGAGGGAAGAGGGAAGAGGAAVALNHYVYVSGSGSPEITGYTFNMTTGALVLAAAAGTSDTGLTNATYLSYLPSGKAIYATDEGNTGRVRAFSIAPATGALTPLATQPTNGANAVHNSVHPSGRWLLASNYGGSVAAFPITAATGDVGARVGPTNSGPESHQIVSSPDGKFVFAPQRGGGAAANANRISIFSFNETTGVMAAHATTPTVTSDDPRHLAFRPDGTFAYLINENPANVVSFAYNAATGVLSSPQTVILEAGEAWGSHIMVSKDYVYAAGRTRSKIWVFKIGVDGRLTPASNIAAGVTTPRDFTIDSTGTWLLTIGEGSKDIQVFKINPADGSLTKTGNAIAGAGNGLQGIVVVPVPKP